ncbi:glucosaminidase domain-containing protein [Maricurvus nonylphenolicus]|uniref:glucosaminidase domain-containing protein n=1 Tax=Maricurvus nonylphenolicus TaxID=1008307 RepID=UPI0036F42D8A
MSPRDSATRDNSGYPFFGLLFLAYGLGLLGLTFYLAEHPYYTPPPKPVVAPTGVQDFAAITHIPARKKAFLGFLLPLINAENDKLAKVREELKRTRTSFLVANKLNVKQKAFVDSLSLQYRQNGQGIGTLERIDQLLLKIDGLPASMVMAQAAMESAWGTSRFARQANNFFGQWCFTRGCGLVPKRRAEGARHEVAKFATPQDAVSAYFRNINSHPAYADVRRLRAELRTQGVSLRGDVIVGGLAQYSARGEAYIEELRSMIKTNNLRQYDR